MNNEIKQKDNGDFICIKDEEIKATHIGKVTKVLYSLSKDTYALRYTNKHWIKSNVTNRQLKHNSMFKEL